MTSRLKTALPLHLLVSVAFPTAAMLLVELIVTRLFSVLFFYHYSFFAVSLVMSGLTFGGLIASRWNMRAAPEAEYPRRKDVKCESRQEDIHATREDIL